MPFDPAKITTMDQVTPVPRQWAWPGFVLAGDLTLWIGTGGTGKGLAWIDLAARITRGWPMAPEVPGSPVTDPETWNAPAYVVIASLEDRSETDTIFRLRAAGADLRYVIDLSRVDVADVNGGSVRSKFSLPRDIPYAEAVIGHYSDPSNEGVLPGGVALMIVDPVMAASTVSLSGNQHVRANLLDPLQDFCERTGIGTLLVGHFHKGAKAGVRNGNLLDYAGGSKGLTDTARLVIVLMSDPTDPRITGMYCAKSNGPKADPVRFMINISGEDGNDTALSWEQPRTESRQYLTARVMRVLADAPGPLTSTQVAAILRVTHSLVRQVIVAQERAGALQKIRNAYAPLALPAGETAEMTPGQ